MWIRNRFQKIDLISFDHFNNFSSIWSLRPFWGFCLEGEQNKSDQNKINQNQSDQIKSDQDQNDHIESFWTKTDKLIL